MALIRISTGKILPEFIKFFHDCHN
jgi:hypothetical protein